jgi:chromate transporter
MPGVTPPGAPPSLAAFTWIVARNVNGTLGGGQPAIELMRQSLGRRELLDATEHGLLVAVSRFTPGTNLLAYCAALGWSFHRGAGALLAVIVGSLPGAIALTLMTAAVAKIDQWPAVRAVLAIATLAAAGLVLSSAWTLARPYLRGSRMMWTAASIALAAVLFAAGATPVRVLLVLAIWGALTPAGAVRGGERRAP